MPRGWRGLLIGAPLDIKLSAPVTAAQTAWLLSTRLPIRRIIFPKEVTGDPPRHDPACSLLATDARALALSAGSLLTATHIVIPSIDLPDESPDPLHRFTALENVALLVDSGIDEARLARLPPSVRRLAVLGDMQLPEDDIMVSVQVCPP